MYHTVNKISNININIVIVKQNKKYKIYQWIIVKLLEILYINYYVINCYVNMVIWINKIVWKGKLISLYYRLYKMKIRCYLNKNNKRKKIGKINNNKFYDFL